LENPLSVNADMNAVLALEIGCTVCVPHSF
jgi:hypothetical protein